MEFGEYFTYGPRAQEHISFPLGGLGGGCLGLSGRGRLVDWEIFNRPNKGSTHGYSHFMIRAERDGEILDCRVLNGPVEKDRSGDINGGNYQSFGFGVNREYLSGLPHFGECEFRGFYPLAEIDFLDFGFPGRVTLRALSPFIPGDVKNSALPVAMFEAEIFNTTDSAIDYTLYGTLASDASCPQSARVTQREDGGSTLFFDPLESNDPDSMSCGALSLSMFDGDVSHQHYWYRGHWFDSLQKYWNAVTTAGALQDRQYEQPLVAGKGGSVNDRDHGTLASVLHIPAGESRTLRMAISWRYPNFEHYWFSNIRTEQLDTQVPDRWKMQHASYWPTLDDAVQHLYSNWSSLWSRTLQFADILRRSDLPEPVLDAVSSTISTLKSPTVSLFEGGVFYGFEGCHVDEGCCEGSCTHVWNYQQALAFLYPELAKSLVKTDFENLLDPQTGGLSFRTALPMGSVRNLDRAAVDGHYGTIIRVYRELKATGDDSWLRENWQQVKQAIGFAWHPGNQDKWDPDKTGVIWGRQHHTLDMELFGPNSWLTSYYLAALRCGVGMAQHMGDTAAAEEYAGMFENGRCWADEHLFNGSYYGQKIDMKDKAMLEQYVDEHHPIMADNADSESKPGTTRDVTAAAIYWNEEAGEIKYQIGDGMVIDQVTGCWLAAICGLDDILDPVQLATSVNATFAESFHQDLRVVANPCRVFAVDGEGGTLICSWPEGTQRPDIPLPYSQETQGGYEYAFGGALLVAGELAKGVAVFKAIRDRYRGWNRNPWNEVECGSNYARSMASYAALPLLSGFDYDMRAGRIGFRPQVECCGRFRSFWALNNAWGEVQVTAESMQLDVATGQLALRELVLPGTTEAAVLQLNGTIVDTKSSDKGVLYFNELVLVAGDSLQVVQLSETLSMATPLAKLGVQVNGCGC